MRGRLLFLVVAVGSLLAGATVARMMAPDRHAVIAAIILKGASFGNEN